MASTPDSRKAIFSECYPDLDSYEVAYLFNLGVKPTVRQISDIVRKTRSPELQSSIGVTKVDALAIQMIGWLVDQGIDLKGFKFDEQGRMTGAPELKV